MKSFREIPPPPTGPASNNLDTALGVANRFRRFLRDIAGVSLVAAALMTLISLLLPQLAEGLLLALWSNLLWNWLGWGSLWMVIVLGLSGLLLLRPPAARFSTTRPPTRWGRIFALEAAAFSSLALLAALGGTSLERANLGQDGGRIGWGLSYLVGLLLSPIGLGGNFWRALVSGIAFVIFLLSGLGLTRPLILWLSRRVEQAADAAAGAEADSAESVSIAPIQPGETQPTVPGGKKKRTIIPLEFRKKFRVENEAEEKTAPISLQSRDERLPPLDLLFNEQVSRPDERNINQTAGLIEKTLAEFGIPAKVVGFKIGPTVTQFAVEPGFVEKGTPTSEAEANRQKVRVSQISALNRDLALALSAERLRIEAPVPGRPYVGVEVPNARSTVVRLRPILETEVFYKLNSPLAIALGRDVSGQPVVADLGRMPHLLIAGTTGSGKSVCIAAMTTCLVMNNAPEDLRLIMIDPKMVELVRFNGLPHLYGKVETSLERILGVLRWTVAEMDHRYKLLEASHARNLDSYNRRVRRRKGELPLPHIVLLIDELADLMMSAPEQTEPALVRLAQMARATGIHLVVATQRPSTDVVTGLIKANFPARISFAVASSVDSRVILDTTGAESLLGHGDMLFLPPEASGPIRAQGVMVSDPEVEKVITFWQKAVRVETEEPPWEDLLKHEAILADRDGLIEQAIQLVRQTQRVSASLLQRRLRIGYPRAARLVDELEEMGIIGPAQSGSREREVLAQPDTEE